MKWKLVLRKETEKTLRQCRNDGIRIVKCKTKYMTINKKDRGMRYVLRAIEVSIRRKLTVFLIDYGKCVTEDRRRIGRKEVAFRKLN